MGFTEESWAGMLNDGEGHMTRKDFEDRMAHFAEMGPADGHVEADALMCEVLRSYGYGKGIDIFEGMSKWYA